MFCTVSDVATFLGISEMQIDSVQITQAIKAASASIRNYCKQEISQKTGDVAYFDGAYQSKLFLPQLPVISVSKVIEDGHVLTEGEDYKLGNNGILYRMWRDWAKGIRNIEVTYTHGYEVIPDDIKEVAYRSAARVYQAQLKAKKTDGVAINSITVGDYSVNYQDDSMRQVDNAIGVSAARTLLKSEKEILDNYRYLGGM